MYNLDVAVELMDKLDDMTMKTMMILKEEREKCLTKKNSEERHELSNLIAHLEVLNNLSTYIITRYELAKQNLELTEKWAKFLHGSFGPEK